MPARARQALADGSAYAYMTWNPQTVVFTAHVVNLTSGSSQSFALAAPLDPEIADHGPAGVYIDSASAWGDQETRYGCSILRPARSSSYDTSTGCGPVRNGYAWIARFDSRDKTVWQPSELAPANSLVRIDLATGAETIWFYRPGHIRGCLAWIRSSGQSCCWAELPTATRCVSSITLGRRVLWCTRATRLASIICK